MCGCWWGFFIHKTGICEVLIVFWKISINCKSMHFPATNIYTPSSSQPTNQPRKQHKTTREEEIAICNACELGCPHKTCFCCLNRRGAPLVVSPSSLHIKQIITPHTRHCSDPLKGSKNSTGGPASLASALY